MVKEVGLIQSIETTSGKKADNSTWTRASIKLNGKSFSTFDSDIIDSYKAGNFVEIEYEKSKDGKYNNIVDIRKNDYKGVEAEDVPKEVPDKVWEDKDRRITRLASINAAIESLRALNEINPDKAKELLKDKTLIDSVMIVAEGYETWVYRGL